MSTYPAECALDVFITGLVQGVGFRPFVYQLATQCQLVGWVVNRNDGVQIRIQGAAPATQQFLQTLQQYAPPLARIETLRIEPVAPEPLTDFRIVASQSTSDAITDVSPDIAVCHECLHDLHTQPNRLNYPFVNCTNCGPRFSIIRDLPYDRARTTMQPFTMCPSCQQEYDDLTNRRFHAQPNACRECGPAYELSVQGQRMHGIETILDNVCRLLESGQIVALKGIGGFHLACDATNEWAIAELRRRKQREGKPFAVMFGNLEKARDYAHISEQEAKLLLSARRPIVLVQSTLTGVKNLSDREIAPSVTRGLATLGLMLPYTPFHHLLLERLRIPAIVLTSGNLSDEPIIISNEEAETRLITVADAVLAYNRDIHNRSDDSVAMVVNNTIRLLRRSRGWTPEPIRVHLNVEGIVAAGAELKNCFCVGKGQQAILSQHIGDLKNLATYEFYQEACARFQRLFRVRPELIACDRHPDYLSTRFARENGLPIVSVQHHHAHIASCMAEYGLDEPVIGISFDGIGFGDDGQIWGGEFLICDLAGYQRFSHFDYVPMPGGDKAAEEPWRMGLAYLYKTFGRNILSWDWPFLHGLEPRQIDILMTAIDQKINCPLTSSVGRLFDAVAAIINIVTISSFEAEAPMRLESLLAQEPPPLRDFQRYGYAVETVVTVQEMIAGIVQDVRHHVPVHRIARKFHNTLLAIMADLAKRMRTATGIRKVMLSGGVFQNRHLLGNAEELLTENGFTVYSPAKVPANDGGICLGQLAVAAKQRRHLGI